MEEKEEKHEELEKVSRETSSEIHEENSSKHWEEEYNRIKNEFEEYKNVKFKEQKLNNIEKLFDNYKALPENRKLLHKLLDEASEPEKDIDNLYKENPHLFASKKTNITENLNKIAQYAEKDEKISEETKEKASKYGLAMKG